MKLSLQRSALDGGAFSLLFIDLPSKPEPCPGPCWGHPLPVAPHCTELAGFLLVNLYHSSYLLSLANREKNHFFSQFNLSAQTVHRSSGNRVNLPQEQWQLSIGILLCDGVLDTRNFISSTIVLLLFPFSHVKWRLAKLK